MPVKKVVDMLISKWGSSAAWVQDEGGHPHEAHSLKLNISKAANLLGWAPKWSLEGAIEHIISWQHAYQNQQDMKAVSLSQIQSYCRS
jgi:CDP-glucose 4,6-dehydratase